MSTRTRLNGKRLPREAERTTRLKVVYRSTGPVRRDPTDARLVIVGKANSAAAQDRALREVHAPHLSRSERDYLSWYHGDPAKRSTNAAHRYSSDHRAQLLKDDRCGCFHCVRIFHPTAITHWIEDKKDGTALCPHCGIDAVIGQGSGYPITGEFLKKMREVWFGQV